MVTGEFEESNNSIIVGSVSVERSLWREVCGEKSVITPIKVTARDGKLTSFGFTASRTFDVKACRGASADFVGRQHKAKVAFDLLGLQKSENPPAKPGQLETGMGGK
ncbi:hypothetical protein B0H14DRAFT_2639829 [Mycena olivaceomarginata]|nr:hypothetical protein B0H14DRAFT_2639829 [Mycena olivaceomarginata]